MAFNVSPISFPQYQVNSTVDPSMWQSLGNLGKVYQQAQSDTAKKSILSQLGPDAAANARLLMGHPDLATMGLNLQGQLRGEGREDARHVITDARADRGETRADRGVVLQENQDRRADRGLVLQENQDVRAGGAAADARQAAIDARAAADRERQKFEVEGTPMNRAKSLISQLGPDIAKAPEGQAYIMGPNYKGPTPGEYEIKDVEINGVKVPYRFKKTGAEGPLAPEASAAAANPTNPLSTGKMTVDQAKLANYTDRMATSHDIIGGFEGINDGIGAVTGSLAEATKDTKYIGTARNWLLSGDRQQYEQAKRDFVNAKLRPESGAVIGPAEFANAEKQYFPQPGDTAEQIAQKRANRLTAIRGSAREAGPAYHPPPSILEPEQRRSASGQGGGADAALRMARNDLANGVSRARVDAWLQGQGIDPADIDKGPKKKDDKKEKAVKQTGTVVDGPNKGKTAIMYTDGTIDYR